MPKNTHPPGAHNAAVDPSWQELDSRLLRIHNFNSIEQLLGWDEQVNLPPAAADSRAAQMATLAATIHQAQADPALECLLRDLEARRATLSADQQTVLHWARRYHDRATRLPEDFVEAKAAQQSRGYHAWAQAKADNDFGSFAPVLAKNLDFARREAAYLGHADAPYDYMIDLHDPGMTAATIERLFDELQSGLVPLARQILSSPVKPPVDLLRGFPVARQRDFLRLVTEKLGFDYRAGRIDTSLHPFCSGSGSDVRMTTRFDVDQPLDALFSAIHETGHGLYEQGLDRTQGHSALGWAAGMGAHESQSRLWENQVARSRAFWRFFEPQLRQMFPGPLAGIDSDQLYLAINAVQPTLIRVDADEITYNLHIVLRFELEKRLFSGELDVSALPDAWREASRRLLGLIPATDREGVLQDVHWSGGAFGYFPSYCIGNMMAAQLWYHLLDLRPRLEEDFAQGDFSWLLGWLRTHVHVVGRRHDTLALVRHATGSDLSPRWLLRYLRERYLPLYPSAFA